MQLLGTISESILLLQGRQRHKRSGTAHAHYRSALRKAVPGGALRVGSGARSVEKIFRMPMRKRSRSIKMAVLGKKRPWLLVEFQW